MVDTMTQELIDEHWKLHMFHADLGAKPKLNSGFAMAIITSNFLEGKKAIGEASDEEMDIIRSQIPVVKVRLKRELS